MCDPRVRFFKGWFDQILTSYEPPPHDVLVVICDADLYSSTIFVLNKLEKLIVPGTYLYFDKFHHQSDELWFSANSPYAQDAFLARRCYSCSEQCNVAAYILITS